MDKKDKKVDGAPKYIRGLFLRCTPDYLANLFHRREKKVRQLESDLKEARKECIDCVEQIIYGFAESERYLSYIIVNRHGRVVGSTPTFRERFEFNNPDRPIKGQQYSKALAFSNEDYNYKAEVKEHLISGEKIELDATIYNGVGEEVMVRFEKYPAIKGVHAGKEHIFTRIDVYEIGRVKRSFNQVLRKLHVINGHPRTIEEFVRDKIVKRANEKAENEKNQILQKYNQEKNE